MNATQDRVNIRRMGASDIDGVLALERKIGGGRSSITYKDMVAIQLGSPRDLSFIAETNGQVIGFLLASLEYVGIPLTELCIIKGIVVEPDYQKRGIASRLVNELLSHCEIEGIDRVRTLVSERDSQLRRFVESLGFHRSVTVNYDKTFEI